MAKVRPVLAGLGRRTLRLLERFQQQYILLAIFVVEGRNTKKPFPTRSCYLQETLNPV
jgi:hypothetical protein